MTGAEIPRNVQEFLKLLSYSSFEFATFPHIITDYIFDTDKTKEDIYEQRIKRIGLYHNSSLVNIECKIEIIVAFFVFFLPLACIFKFVTQVTGPRKMILEH